MRRKNKRRKRFTRKGYNFGYIRTFEKSLNFGEDIQSIRQSIPDRITPLPFDRGISN